MEWPHSKVLLAVCDNIHCYGSVSWLQHPRPDLQLSRWALWAFRGVSIFSKTWFKNTISLVCSKSCVNEGVNAFISSVTAEGGKHLSHKSSGEIKEWRGMLSEAILEPTRSESDTVTVYMKLESGSVAHNFFCVKGSLLHICSFSQYIMLASLHWLTFDSKIFLLWLLMLD